MAEIGKYIYGIVNSGDPVNFSLAHDSFGEQKIYAVPYEDISVVISDSIIVDFKHHPKETLAKFLINHQMVIEKIMSSGLSIIPMKLGTFVTDESEVEKIVNHKGRHGFIKEILNRTIDKIEIDVVVTWNQLNLAIQEAAEEKEIKELKQKLLANPKKITVDDQFKVGVLLKKALDEKRASAAHDIQEALKPYCDELKQHELMDDHMVMNTAFLAQKNKQKDFLKEVDEMNARFKEKFNFRCVGPLPPYSFYTLELKTIHCNEIDRARNSLGLANDAMEPGKLKEAYQRKALSVHPDKNPGVSGIEKEFNEVVEAYKTLVEYYKACEQSGPEFAAQEQCQNVLFLKVKE